jgi:predicted acylesterase/phospholipase RssA
MAKKKLEIDFALQGGGSHGAFAWGVMDRFLEEDWLDVAGIAGTSAGSMNAAVFVSGYALGGKEGAKEKMPLIIFGKQYLMVPFSVHLRGRRLISCKANGP